MSLSHLYPIFHLIMSGHILVKQHTSAIVVTIPQNITAESTLTLSAVCFNKIKMPFLKRDILLPDLRIKIIALRKDLRENRLKLNCFHFDIYLKNLVYHYFNVYTTELRFPKIGLSREVTAAMASPLLPVLLRLITIANFCPLISFLISAETG